MNDHSNNFSGTASKLSQAGWDGYFHFQRQWLQMFGMIKNGVIKNDADLSTSQNSGLALFRAWMDVYENEFRKFLTPPQLGLTRYYQERIRELLDKFNLFQAKMSEFTYSLFRPMEESFRALPQRVEELNRSGEFSCNPKEYYQVWIRILEGYYSNWFRSSKYSQIMNSTLDALEELTKARQKFLESFLQTFSVPSYTDFDDLSKELYELKKRVKELERKNKQEWAIAHPAQNRRNASSRKKE